MPRQQPEQAAGAGRLGGESEAAAAEGSSNAPAPPRLERALGAVAMALICLISFANVVVRYATDISFAFTEEYSVVLLVIMTFVGGSLAFAADRHIRITVLVDRLPPRWRRLCAGLSRVATTTVLCLIVFYGGRLTYEQWLFEETSPGLGKPAWIYTIWLPALALLMVFRLWQRVLAAPRPNR